MDKKCSYLLALAITSLIAANYYFIQEFPSQGLEPFTIGRVIDGDTLVDNYGRTIRLLNINSPESNLPESQMSKNFLKNFENQTLFIEITGEDKYNRFLGRIYSKDKYLNLEIVSLGLASKFLVDSSELSIFDLAERDAVEKEKGIWKLSRYSKCIYVNLDERGEVVHIENACPGLSFNGWYLKDESRKIYTFENIKVNKIRLHSLNGEDNETDLFWKSNQNVWNNDRDTLYLFDSDGHIVVHHAYGY